MKKIKSIIRDIFSRPIFQSVFESLLNFSLNVLNIGEGHTVETSGEKSIFEILKKISDDKEVIVFDVGAHTGEWFKLFKEHYDKKSTVYSFEPSAESYEKLAKIKIDGFRTERLALGDLPGKSYLTSENLGASTSHVSDKDSATNSEKIDISTVDIYCMDHGIQNIDLLKMGVEGYELKVLAGASEMINNGKIKLIQFEFGAQSEEKYSLKDFFDVLNGQYEIYRILKHGYYPLKKYHHYYEIMTVTNFIAIKKTEINKK